MRTIIIFGIFSAVLPAQTPSQADLAQLTRELRSAVEHDELTTAADLAEKLNAGVHAAQSAWLIRDARAQTDDALSWLPADTESFWVNQEPFTIKAEDSLMLLQEQPVRFYSVDRLFALNEGKFHHALANHTVRMVMAATKGIRNPYQVVISRLIADQDVVYFYFLSEPVDLGAPDESIENRPAWRGVAQVDAGGPIKPGERAQREDANWIALARPDLLVLSNRRELLGEILGRVANGSATRALPASLPEWAGVDRNASFWGLRIYTDQSKPKSGEREFQQLPYPDRGAISATVQFDAVSKRLEIRYTSPAPLAKPAVGFDNLRKEFQVDQPSAGVWRLVSNLREMDPWPMRSVAISMLGFGDYQ
jgi:hypothetical protein